MHMMSQTEGRPRSVVIGSCIRAACMSAVPLSHVHPEPIHEPMSDLLLPLSESPFRIRWVFWMLKLKLLYLSCPWGLHGCLWQVFEGLADLNYQRRQLDTSISYYKETLSQLSRSGAHEALQRQIITKLAAALEIQQAGVVKALSYKNRVPVLINPNQVRDGILGRNYYSSE